MNVLSLGGNQIIEVPDTVGNLHQLQALSLSDNLIEVLPSSIARLSNLKTLSLHKNRIRHLPRDIITLKNLVEVGVKMIKLISDNFSQFDIHQLIIIFYYSLIFFSYRIFVVVIA